jgi:hypothetical protein
MVDVVIHFRGVGPQRQQLAAVPAVGNYIFGPGAERRLWQVGAVAIDGAAVDVFAIEVSHRSVGELAAAWKAWGGQEAPIIAAVPAAGGGIRGNPDNVRGIRGRSS